MKDQIYGDEITIEGMQQDIDSLKEIIALNPENLRSSREALKQTVVDLENDLKMVKRELEQKVEFN